MNSPNELKEITRFLLEYANRLMGSGVHTSRDTKHSPHRKVTGCRRENEPFSKDYGSKRMRHRQH